MSGGAKSHEPIDIGWKLVIVGVLVGAILLLHQFAAPRGEFDSRGLLALGFVVLAAYTIGELAEVIRLPHITGYLLAGLVLGPSAAHIVSGQLPPGTLPPPLDHGVLSQAVVDQLGLLDALALALIALTAGGELKLDELRKGIRHITGVLVGQALTIGIGIVIFLVAATKLLPDTLPALAALDMPALLALGAVLAAISFATSPAATIAVITSTGSKGPMSTTVLSAVVLKDVVVVIAFSAATAAAVGVIGSEGATSLGESLWHITLSILLGVGLGGLIHLYLRFIGAELLLFLVATIYTATFVVQELHGEAALTFIVAGIVVGNFSDKGETLIHEVERLSLPVYVVFFTLAGAKLHLDQLWVMLVPAVGLSVLRGLALWSGVTAGAVVSGAHDSIRRYGWMGFVSQAGLAILLASQTRATFGDEIGGTMFSLILGGVALNEIAGPVMLQWGLGLADETADSGDPVSPLTEEAPMPGAEVQRWTAPDPDSTDAWGHPMSSGAPELDAAIEELARDMQALARDKTWGPLSDQRRDNEAWMRQLRRELLRVLRRASVRGDTGAELAAALRHDIGELGERWRDLVLDLAARTPRPDRWSPRGLVDAIDDHVATLDVVVRAPIHHSTLESTEESMWMALRRTGLRMRQRVPGGRGGREVSVHALARYRLSGEVPARLEGVAALLVNAELHLADRTNALFALIAAGLEEAAKAAEGDDTEAWKARLEALRSELDDEFAAAVSEIDAMAADANDRVARTLGDALKGLRLDARQIGTLDLPHRHRRFSRVFADRNRGLTALGTGLQQAREAVSSRLSQLALELEIVGLQGRVHDVVHQEGDRLVRALRGRGPRQLELVEAGLSEWVAEIDALLGGDLLPPAMAARVRELAEPLVHRIAEARGHVEGLAAQLADESWVTGLLEGLLVHVQDLTEHYEVPTEPVQRAESTLPSPVPTTELDFREVVASFVEARVTRRLLDVTGDLSGWAAEVVEALHEVERVVAFNAELAGAELDVLDADDALPAETRKLVEAMVSGAVGRSLHRMQRLLSESKEIADDADLRVHEAVIEPFDELRQTILEGRVSELRTLWLRDAHLGRQIVERAEAWRGLLPTLSDQAGTLARRALGEDRVLALEAALGLPERGDERELRSALRPPQPLESVPMVYRRLFSDQALEAGDVLAGRQEELERLKACMASRGGLRSAAVVGLDAQASLALVTSALRAGGGVAVRWETDAPVSVAQVSDWFEELQGESGRTVVVPSLRWMFSRRPGGFDALDALVAGIVADTGRNAFVLVADQAVWRFATRISGLREAMANVVHMAPLSVEELEESLLSRHAMSGYGVEFEADEDLGWQLEHVLLRGESRERRRRRAWFRTLHGASAGVLQDALRLWMASIREVDDGAEIVRMGAVPRPPLTRLQDLPEPTLLTLLQLSWQGWITAGQHATLFRTDTGHSEAHLAQLHHVGLLVRDDEVLRLAPHLRGPLERVLKRRGWA